ncbi:MAG: YgiQ family radical SAM protein, partial [Christensenellaceae bacterium]|nr:YgiQ family radical SAM protein [Christensenellaceae bacterium]
MHSEIIPIEPIENTIFDYIVVTPEAFVDHPSFGTAIIARLTEREGNTVAVMAQPQNADDFTKFGAPKRAFLVSGGVVDSMVNNYTVAKNRRAEDVYSENGKYGLRPDRAVTVYCKALKKAYPDTPIVIGGIEASLRRFAHYDYWTDSVYPSILADCGADILVYGMGEVPLVEILSRLKNNEPLKGIKGTAYLTDKNGLPPSIKPFTEDGTGNEKYLYCHSFDEVKTDKYKYALSFKLQSENSNPIVGKGIVQRHPCNQYLVCEPPCDPISTAELDKVYALPFTGKPHPSYRGRIPASEEIEFSITSHRGCFGGCSYCALTFHQGRMITKRSKVSIIEEAEKLANDPSFKGYINDVGGPTANFRNPSCKKQLKAGVCKNRQCIGFSPCPNLEVDHSEYFEILRELKKIAKVKKVFIRSGIRYDYLLMDKNCKKYLKELCEEHISGQLKVAPEHTSDKVLQLMNKPSFRVYKEFRALYTEENARQGKKQFLVPYLISSHPGATLKDAVNVTEYLRSVNYCPEQVQDFYPT